MSPLLELLRGEPRARRFFTVLLQSALGTGAGYIALLLIATERLHSPWSVSLILLADLMPSMFLGPVFGAVADRVSRRGCMIVADVLRAGVYAGIVFVDSFEATAVLALAAGAGTALFTPSALAALPSVVDDDRHIPAANSAYGAVADLGFTIGPALAALVFAIWSPEAVVGINAITFGLSALLLATIRFGAAPGRDDRPSVQPTLWRETIDGVVALRRAGPIRTVVLASSATLFCAGLLNVGELFYATKVLDSGQSGFALLTVALGVGFIVGSLSGTKGGSAAQLKQRYLVGLLAAGVGIFGIALSPSVAVAVIPFAIGGFGNGALLVYERLLIQSEVGDELRGRTFGIKDALTAWAFAISFLAGGVVLSSTGSRPLLVAAGAIGVAVWIGSAFALRDAWIARGDDQLPDVRSP